MADDLAKDPGLNALLEKKQQIDLLMSQAEGETDPARITALAEVLSGEAAELEAMGNTFQEVKGAKGGPAGTVEIVLTPEQRYRIYWKTGIDMETVRIPDEGGIVSQTMPAQKPQTIEVWALREAERRRNVVIATITAQAEMDASIAVIEASIAQAGSPEAADAFASVRDNLKR